MAPVTTRPFLAADATVIVPDDDCWAPARSFQRPLPARLILRFVCVTPSEQSTGKGPRSLEVESYDGLLFQNHCCSAFAIPHHDAVKAVIVHGAISVNA
ncbi:unnamed protein product [Penicillium manginii]